MNALDTLLTAVFADQPSPEGGPYGAAPLPLGPVMRRTYNYCESCPR